MLLCMRVCSLQGAVEIECPKVVRRPGGRPFHERTQAAAIMALVICSWCSRLGATWAGVSWMELGD